MIGITIDCRLGNQLFQYAFIKSLSLKLKTPFFLNEKVEKFMVDDYFDLEGYHSWLNKPFRLYFKIRYGSPFKSLQSVPVSQYAENLPAFNNGVIYQGYFQSELFFNDHLTNLNKYIRVKKSYTASFAEKYGSKFRNNPTIVVHIRRGDYLQLNDWWAQNLGSSDLSLPKSYYSSCLSQVRDLENYKIIFISDDQKYTRSAFAGTPNAEFADGDLITDFQLLMNADICILSHSTFSWWAAYLNTKKNKQVFCPQYWLGFKIQKEYPASIIPQNWIQMPVDNINE